MKIGITYNPSLPFSSGAQTAITLYDLFKADESNEVILVNTGVKDKDWWDDYNTLYEKLDEEVEVKKEYLYEVKDLDLLIDIDCVVYPDIRKRIAKQTVVLLRDFLQFSELDKSIYIETTINIQRYNEVKEIWVWDIMNPIETLDSVELLFPCPIRRVPFIWTETHLRLYKHTQVHGRNVFKKDKSWDIYINEKNKNNTSSAILPLTIMREIENRHKNKFKFYVHATNEFIGNEFLKLNVLKNIKSDEINYEVKSPCEFMSIYDRDKNQIVISHTRFLPFCVELLDLIWMGIPFVHNSPIIRKISKQLNFLYYPNNNINTACNKIDKIFELEEEWFGNDDSRDYIRSKWGITPNTFAEWNNILQNFKMEKNDGENKNGQEQLKSDLIIAFSDFWPGFNFNSNFFTDALQNEINNLGLNYVVKGVEYCYKNKHSLLIFGPFGDTWKSVHDIPKIYFSAENVQPPSNEDISLFLTPFRHEDNKHIRLPTWMIFLNWFSKSKCMPPDSGDNPIRIPIHFATTPHTTQFEERKEFCGFVVSNPCCQLRNEAFTVLNEYKRVNSGGALFNNIGGRLDLKYPGGGSGDLSKFRFLSQHKFNICFENSQADGYITEKVLHAKIAGCVPIYWGDKNTDTDFTEGSIVNLSHYNSYEDVVEKIKELENNVDECSKIAQTPALSAELLENSYKIISNIANKILCIAGIISGKNKLNEPMINEQANKGFDKICVINLDRRQDRWESLLKLYPDDLSKAERISAVDGKTLELNETIYKLFKNNDHKWKKSVMGCALSHIHIWLKLLKEPDTINSYLVLEDDARFNNEWVFDLKNIAENIPKDAELLYLGGVLPPNKSAYNSVLDPVNNYWSVIKPNTLFGPTPKPVFHFCTYSYIITKSGAKKLIDFLIHSDKRCFTSIDHYLGNPDLNLKKYVLTNLITRCFQDEDIKYLQADFNNFNRIDTFDSDIWNNTDMFVVEDIIKSSIFVLDDTLTQQELDNLFFKTDKKIKLYYVKGIGDYPQKNLYEDEWLKDIFSDYNLCELVFDSSNIGNNSWFLVMRPTIGIFNEYFKQLDDMNIPFNVLHLSDEFCQDDISFYKLENCKNVIRSYPRFDTECMKNVFTIPLGYHYKAPNNKSFTEREFVWSFHGTNWFNRKEILKNIDEFNPNCCKFTSEWNDPAMTPRDEYIDILSNTKICPILRGNNIETFRFYEVLEAGTIPLYVRTEGDEIFWNFITQKIPLLCIESWDKAKMVMQYFIKNHEKAEEYRRGLNDKWQKYKIELQSRIKNIL